MGYYLRFAGIFSASIFALFTSSIALLLLCFVAYYINDNISED